MSQYPIITLEVNNPNTHAFHDRTTIRIALQDENNLSYIGRPIDLDHEYTITLKWPKYHWHRKDNP